MTLDRRSFLTLATLGTAATLVARQSPEQPSAVPPFELEDRLKAARMGADDGAKS